MVNSLLIYLMSQVAKCLTSDEASGQVVDDVAVEVGHHHDVKLLRVGDHLKGNMA